MKKWDLLGQHMCVSNPKTTPEPDVVLLTDVIIMNTRGIVLSRKYRLWYKMLFPAVIPSTFSHFLRNCCFTLLRRTIKRNMQYIWVIQLKIKVVEFCTPKSKRRKKCMFDINFCFLILGGYNFFS